MKNFISIQTLNDICYNILLTEVEVFCLHPDEIGFLFKSGKELIFKRNDVQEFNAALQACADFLNSKE